MPPAIATSAGRRRAGRASPPTRCPGRRGRRRARFAGGSGSSAKGPSRTERPTGHGPRAGRRRCRGRYYTSHTENGQPRPGLAFPRRRTMVRPRPPFFSRRKTAMLRLLLAAGVLCAAAAVAHADAKLADQLTGTWVHRVEGHKVTLAVQPTSLRCTISLPDGVSIVVEADYVVSKDGVLLGIIRPSGKAAKSEDKDVIGERTFGG